jgi:ABC-type antimicrobial peptide transport system permease subunit
VGLYFALLGGGLGICLSFNLGMKKGQIFNACPFRSLFHIAYYRSFIIFVMVLIFYIARGYTANNLNGTSFFMLRLAFISALSY